MSSSTNDEKPALIGTPVVAKNGGHERTGWIVGLLALAAAAGGGYYYHTTSSTDAAPGVRGGPGGAADFKKGGGRFGAGGGPMPVVVAPVRSETMDVRLAALGNVVPRNSVVVRSRVDGPLLRLYFKEGQQVKAGQLLAEIDPLPLQASMAQMNGQLARDQALLTNAQIDLNRYKGLLATDSIAKQQVDTQEATVRQYQGVVAADRGQADAARLQLGYTRITAPISGQVGLRQVDPGNIVRASDANGLVSITQMDPITAVFAIPEAQVASVIKRMREDASVPVEAWDGTQKIRLGAGKLISTDNQIDVATGTLKLKAEFANTDGLLFPNQFVNVRVLLGQEKDLVVVPVPAVQRGSQGTFAYVVKADSTVSMRPVKTGLVDGERIAIMSGLAAGERVVIDGADKLREGARVEVIDRNTPPPGARPPGEGRRRGDGKGKGGAEGKPGSDAKGGTVEGKATEGKPEAKAEARPDAKSSSSVKGDRSVTPAAGAGAAAPGAASSAATAPAGAPSDAEREERRRRAREIMENGTEEQKAELRQRFRERQAAGGGGPPGKGAP